MSLTIGGHGSFDGKSNGRQHAQLVEQLAI